ncbi:MFS antiporter QDR3 [Parachaetomium inaequale]|uniref:MFS antiporter QDR3 n=1 Tax=Parachaetomium inaequale TaxID=2588326 RepID=A0AAN6PIA9_9PEZI|nr:MFS antiporter QDR3 [Parachaetomium inaequale]
MDDDQPKTAANTAAEGTVPRWSFVVLNPKITAQVPGTVQLLSNADCELDPEQQHEDNSLKTTANGKIILSPQPSHSPNDPLNWPRWRRDAALISLGLFCAVGGGMPIILAAGFTEIAADYSVPVSQIALTTGVVNIGLGVGSVLAGPTAIIFGKRPVYLGSVVLFIISAVWCALSPSFVSLLLARMVQGAALSVTEALPSATIADIFFLHERAFRVGIYALMFLGGKNLVPLASAAVIGAWGWRWVFWIAVIVGVVCGILIFTFLAETFWDRTLVHDGEIPAHSPRAATPEDSSSKTDKLKIAPEAKSHATDDYISSPSSLADCSPPPATPDDLENKPLPPPTIIHVIGDTTTTTTPTTNNTYTSHRASLPALPFVSHLRPYHGRLLPSSNTRWHHAFLRPFLLLLYPSILWSAAVYACSIGWLIVLAECVTVVYRSQATYHLSALQAGLVYLSPFVGGVLGTAAAGRVSDLVVRAMARRNGGVYEPEFRLVMVLPVAVCTGAGLMAFGWSAGVGDSVMVPTVWFGVVAFGCALGSTTAITFCVDSYKEFASEALVTLSFVKNICHGMVFSFFVTEWVESDGPKTVFIWIGVIQLIVLAFTVPMCIYGKRARHWTARDSFYPARSVIFKQ